MKRPGLKRQKLVCDACHYMEDVDRLHKGLIGKQCPDCQTVMLTAEEYRIGKRVEWKLIVLAWLSHLIAKMYPAARTGVISVHVRNGDTQTSFEEERR